MPNNKILIILLFVLIILSWGCRKGEYYSDPSEETIRDYGEGTGTVTWKKDVSYIIEGFVFVNDGQVLTIEPGTVIRAKTGQGSAASALIVARGGMIMAQGSSNEPIIFTVEGDDLEGSVPVEAKGLWGGLIILGDASLNISSGEAHIEGIPLYEPRGVYGGLNDDDNSGVLSYLSIRHSGTNIGEGNEINGLTLGGVGRGTTIDHIEVISSADDGVEIFGGTARMKYLSLSFCGDDILDYDIGFRGYCQFLLGIQESSQGNRLIEASGGSDPVTGQPYSQPYLYNLTMIGKGMNGSANTMTFNLNAGGHIANSIFLEQNKGVYVEYIEGSSNSFQQLQSGNLGLNSNMFYNIGSNTFESVFHVYSGTGVNVDEQTAWFVQYCEDEFNEISDPGIMVTDSYINPLPQNNVYENLAELPDPWFDETIYKGGFYTYNWASGWTLLSQAGFID